MNTYLPSEPEPNATLRALHWEDLQPPRTSPRPLGSDYVESVEMSLRQLIQAAVQNPLPEETLSVALDLIKTASGSDLEPSFLSDTLGGLGPFKFPLEVIVRRACDVLNVSHSPISLQSM